MRSFTSFIKTSAAVAAIVLTAPAQSLAQTAGATSCSAVQTYKQSNYRKNQLKPGLGSDYARAARGATYAAFMDAFWSAIDKALAVGNPNDVGGVIDLIENAYRAASNRATANVARVGTTPYLTFDTLGSKIDFGLRDLKTNTHIKNDPRLQQVMRATEIGKFDIYIKFQHPKYAYTTEAIATNIQAGLSITDHIGEWLQKSPDTLDYGDMKSLTYFLRGCREQPPVAKDTDVDPEPAPREEFKYLLPPASKYKI